MKFDFVGGEGNEELAFNNETLIITDPCYVVPHDTEENNSNKWHEMLHLIDGAEPELGIYVENAPINKFISNSDLDILLEVNRLKDEVTTQEDLAEVNDRLREGADKLLMSVLNAYANPDYTFYSSPYLKGHPDGYTLPSKNSLISLGISKSLVGHTIYGDWSCTTIDVATNEVIGQFCADAGMYIIASLEDILKYNPDFEEWRDQHPWCVTTIPNFTGWVEVTPVLHSYTHKEGMTSLEKSIRINGYGSINFTTRQSGF